MNKVEGGSNCTALGFWHLVIYKIKA